MSKKTITDEQILEAVTTEADAAAAMAKLGIKTLFTLQDRIAKIQHKEKRFINIEGLYPPPKPRKGFGRKTPKIDKYNDLLLTAAWLRDSNFKIGDTFTVKFSKDKITLSKLSSPMEKAEVVAPTPAQGTPTE